MQDILTPGNHDNEVRSALLFQRLACFPPSQLQELLALYGSFSTALEQLISPVGENIALQYEQQQKLQNFTANRKEWCHRVDTFLQRLDSLAITAIAVTAANYPRLLREIPSPPPLLYVQGNSDLLHLPQLAIVGSRHASRGGLENARNFARVLAANGCVITSGLALGIDGAAHTGALEAGREKTVAVLGSGLDVVYPKRHAGLREEILQSGGVLVSEFAPGTPALPKNFPRRNRIISGLSMGVLVVEAALKSGSLITARYALSQGREVFALPGSIHNPGSRGCHRLIRDGATLVETAQDVVDQLGGMVTFFAEGLAQTGQPEQQGMQDDIQQALLTVLGYDPMSIDELIQAGNLTAAEVNGGLLDLELAGLVENRAGLISRLK